MNLKRFYTSKELQTTLALISMLVAVAALIIQLFFKKPANSDLSGFCDKSIKKNCLYKK